VSVEVRPPEDGGAKRVADTINRIAGAFARHWLAIFNIVVLLFVALPFLAPVLMQAGATGAGSLIYKIYAPTCHQLPERSIFLFGDERFYSAHDLESHGHLPAGLNILQRQSLRWVGSPETGWKVAICQRDVAIYGAILLAGLAFALLRPILGRGGKWRKMPVLMYLALLLPIVLDGVSQLVGLRESTPTLRFITGAIMGAATVWFAYPYVEEAMRSAARQARSVETTAQAANPGR
jgi:uncharacterized membrane protein